MEEALEGGLEELLDLVLNKDKFLRWLSLSLESELDSELEDSDNLLLLNEKEEIVSSSDKMDNFPFNFASLTSNLALSKRIFFLKDDEEDEPQADIFGQERPRIY